MPKYNIGDTVWHVQANRGEHWVDCPNCLGHGCVTVILGDGTQVSVDCACGQYSHQIRGKEQRYDWTAECKQDAICGMEIAGNKTEYHVGTRYSHWCIPEDRVYATREECEVAAAIVVAEHEIEEQKRVEQKEKPHKTWAGNAAYHRNQIRSHEKEIAYHKAKLAVASVKAKEHATEG